MAAQLSSSFIVTVGLEIIPHKVKLVDTLVAKATFLVRNVMLEARRKRKSRKMAFINSSRFIGNFPLTPNQADSYPLVVVPSNRQGLHVHHPISWLKLKSSWPQLA